MSKEGLFRTRDLAAAIGQARSKGNPMKNLFDVSGKVALVTRGSRGIGKMIKQGYVVKGPTTYISARKAEACRKRPRL